ncbi:hypothetical protein PLICRDRAFT_33367 [Plicaturopsis crispa FD-325 SS-3]|nr:hypothetical protein PLICRDRAFT_33367 [Plicaturopsis crispa FD-325 SS-3]
MKQFTPSPPFLLPEREVVLYYAGLPSSPLLLARSGPTPWADTGRGVPGMWLTYRELRAVFDRDIHELDASLV